MQVLTYSVFFISLGFNFRPHAAMRPSAHSNQARVRQSHGAQPAVQPATAGPMCCWVSRSWKVSVIQASFFRFYLAETGISVLRCTDRLCRCGEMEDAQDLKSWDRKKSCGFESRHRHQTEKPAVNFTGAITASNRLINRHLCRRKPTTCERL